MQEAYGLWASAGRDDWASADAEKTRGEDARDDGGNDRGQHDDGHHIGRGSHIRATFSLPQPRRPRGPPAPV